MSTDTLPLPTTAQTARRRTNLALFAMAATSFILVTAEFLPGGLLTDIAHSLNITDGQAGLTVAVTAFAGLLVAPLIGALTPGIDRRRVMVTLAILAAVSNIGVALAPTLPIMLVSRFLIGAALGAFWSLSLAVVAQSLRGGDVARGMMIVNAGTTLATVAGVPLGLALSTVAPWREVFVVLSVITLAVAVTLRLALPSIPAESSASLRSLAATFRRTGVAQAWAGHTLVVLGHMGAYAFIRVLVEQIPGSTPGQIALLLTAYGVGAFVGNLVIGAIASRALRTLSIAVPVILGTSVITLALWPSIVVALIAVVLWGACFGGWLVVANTWTAAALPDALEEGGALIVIGFQLAITLGAAVGGLIVDNWGVAALAVAAGLSAMLGGVLFVTAPRAVSAPRSDAARH